MGFSQATINDAVNWLVNQFTNQVIAFPNGTYKGQCTAPVVWYFNHLGVPVPTMAHDRADGWGTDFPGALAPYFTLETFDANKVYPRGSVMMWNSPHIAVVLHDEPGNIVQVFEQNADPDGAPCKSTGRTAVTKFRQANYVLIPIINQPAPTPAPSTTPAAPITPAGNPDNRYTVIVPIHGYTTGTNAGNHTNPANEIAPGEYYVYNTHPNNASLINITTKLGAPGSWINKADNVEAPPIPPEPPKPVEPPAPVVPEPVPEPAAPEPPAKPEWQNTYVPFPAPVKYLAARALTVDDLEVANRTPLPLPKYGHTEAGAEIGIVNVYGTVVKDGVYYYRVRIYTDTNFDYWYCIPKVDAATRTANLLVKPTVPGAPISKSTLARDTMVLARSKIESGFPKFLDDILPSWLKPKNKK